MEEESTAELIDYLRLVWKWRWFIVILTFGCAIAAGVIRFSMPKIYEVSMVIEPGAIDFDSSGRAISVDSLSNIKSKVDFGAYNRRIFKRSDADPIRPNNK